MYYLVLVKVQSLNLTSNDSYSTYKVIEVMDSRKGLVMLKSFLKLLSKKLVGIGFSQKNL